MQDKHKIKPKINVVSNLSIPLCILTLLLLGYGIISTSTIIPDSGKAYALENDDLPDSTVSDGTPLESSVSITFSPATGSVSLEPISSDGVATKINTTASINIENSGGYSIYLSGASDHLIGRSSTNTYTIPSVAGYTSFTDLPVNTWGYSATLSSNSVPDNTLYTAIPTGQGIKLYTNSNQQILTDSQSVALSFAAKINNQVPADVYENTVTLSVVSSPRKVAAFNDIKTMQALTPAICKEADENDTAYLEDARDGNYYWVTKLADGNCWMSQNLALNLTKDVPVEASIINEDGSMGVFSYIPEATTITNHQYSGEIDGIKFMSKANNSWNEGEWVLTWPLVRLGNGYTSQEKNGVEYFQELGMVQNVATANWQASTDPNFTKATQYIFNGIVHNKETGQTSDTFTHIYDAHYLVGNYYQWLAAVALTTEQSKDVQPGMSMKTSICPKNWRLPSSGTGDYENTSNGSFYNLLKNYGNLATSTSTGLTLPVQSEATYNIAASPLFFTPNGLVYPGDIRNFSAGGRNWSSVAASFTSGGTVQSFYLSFIDGAVNPSRIYASTNGFSVRCLVLSLEG